MSTSQRAFSPAKPASLSLRVALACATLAGHALRVHHALSNRRKVSGLLALDDRMLSDIGVSRSEVEGALGSRWQDDPSEMLARKRFHRAPFRDGKFAAL